MHQEDSGTVENQCTWFWSTFKCKQKPTDWQNVHQFLSVGNSLVAQPRFIWGWKHGLLSRMPFWEVMFIEADNLQVKCFVQKLNLWANNQSQAMVCRQADWGWYTNHSMRVSTMSCQLCLFCEKVSLHEHFTRQEVCLNLWFLEECWRVQL